MTRLQYTKQAANQLLILQLLQPLQTASKEKNKNNKNKNQQHGKTKIQLTKIPGTEKKKRKKPY